MKGATKTRNRSRDKPQKDDPFKPRIDLERSDENSWIGKMKVRKVKPASNRSDALVLKTEADTYAEMLNSRRRGH